MEKKELLNGVGRDLSKSDMWEKLSKQKERREGINSVVSEVEQFQELTRSPVWPWKWVTEVGDFGPGGSRN